MNAPMRNELNERVARAWLTASGYRWCDLSPKQKADHLQYAAAALAAYDTELTEALYDIRNRILCPVGPSPTLDEVQEIASAALKGDASTEGSQPSS